MPTLDAAAKSTFRFSGHQTFPLRIAWLPKAIGELMKGNDPLSNVDQGIANLGLGKNMVESLRCWIEAFQIASRHESGWTLSPLGELVFSSKGGLDPYLEDHSTNWLLHWLICMNSKSPFFAWECLFNRWPSTAFSATPVLEVFRRASDEHPKPVSTTTLRQHWEVFLHSYRPPRTGRGEDHLDSALSVLGLIREAGETQNGAGKWETRYEFDTAHKLAIPQQLFAFFLHDWWNRAFSAEETVPIRELVAGDHSPGRILKMQEAEILMRIADLGQAKPQTFAATESANLRQLRRIRKSDGHDCLRAAYQSPKFL